MKVSGDSSPPQARWTSAHAMAKAGTPVALDGGEQLLKRCLQWTPHPTGNRQKASSARSIRSVSTFSTTARVAEIAGRMVLAKNEAAASLPR